jgi:hypothetical protein
VRTGTTMTLVTAIACGVASWPMAFCSTTKPAKLLSFYAGINIPAESGPNITYH